MIETIDIDPDILELAKAVLCSIKEYTKGPQQAYEVLLMTHVLLQLITEGDDVEEMLRHYCDDFRLNYRINTTGVPLQ